MRGSKLRLLTLAALIFGGGLMQFGGCSVDGAINYITDFNPCGSILLCDPVAYTFLTSGYEGPGVNPDIDPACTYPPYCANDPFVGGGGEP